MEGLTIRIKKSRDGSGALSCMRANGSITWQRQREGLAGFFARHDLTHYAVETVLGYRKGFFGLVADGWDLTDFGAPWPRGPLPVDLDPSEVIVGLLAVEAASGAEWTAAAFSEQAAASGSRAGSQPPLLLTEGQLAAIRHRLRELFERWEALPPGETLELTFQPAG